MPFQVSLFFFILTINILEARFYSVVQCFAGVPAVLTLV